MQGIEKDDTEMSFRRGYSVALLQLEYPRTSPQGSIIDVPAMASPTCPTPIVVPCCAVEFLLVCSVPCCNGSTRVGLVSGLIDAPALAGVTCPTLFRQLQHGRNSYIAVPADDMDRVES
jgi:hypothetical protein